MGSQMVVAMYPFFSKLPYLIECVKDVSVKYCAAIAAIKSFDVTVLHRSSGLNVTDLDVAMIAPLHKSFAEKLRSVIAPDAPGFTSQFNDLLQYARDAKRGKAGINFNA